MIDQLLAPVERWVRPSQVVGVHRCDATIQGCKSPRQRGLPRPAVTVDADNQCSAVTPVAAQLLPHVAIRVLFPPHTGRVDVAGVYSLYPRWAPLSAGHMSDST